MRKRRNTNFLTLLLLGIALLSLVLCWLLFPQEKEKVDVEVEISVLFPDGEIRQVALEDFVFQVLAGEMPASFQPEALAAQAIAARTYLCGKMLQPKHGEAAVCCDSTCCQAWVDPDSLENKWGEEAKTYTAKLKAAVADTEGLILVYEGEPAQAFFCSTCGGKTEASGAVWSQDIPYLQPVSCGYCEISPRFAGAKAFSLTECSALLGVAPEALGEMYVNGQTPGGRVDYLTVGEKTYRGTEIRSLLGLNSAAFAWLIRGEEIIWLTLGYGHGVGLCQYGAEGMAMRGYPYPEILLHNYPGCTIQDISCIIGT